jgi:hypothetical protein
MAAFCQTQAWRRVLSPGAFGVLLVAVALAMIRSRQQPNLDLSLAGTTVSISTLDVVLVVLAVLALRELLGRRELDLRVAVPAAAFGAAIVLSSATNGMTAFVTGSKLVLLGALALGAAAFVTSPDRLHALLLTLVAMTLAADAVGLGNYVANGGGRQQSFLGEHDFAALATIPLLYGLITLFAPDRRTPWLRWPAIVLGGLGISLAAAIASLIGLYLGFVLLLAIAWRRGAFDRRAALTGLAVVLAVSIPTFWLRNNDLGFLHQWFGKPPARQAEYASSWSQRLIYLYIDGRVFLDHPVVGTGWWGNLPPEEFARYVPDARGRFPDNPPWYFPSTDGEFVPQEAWDQVPAQLGVVGAVLLLALVAGVVRSNARTARAWPRGAGDEWAPYVPALVTAAAVGVLSGESLYGGTPTAGLFWLTIGLAAASVRPEEAQ